MTRKDYELIAAEIRWVDQQGQYVDPIELLVTRLCVVLGLDNPQFNETLFRKACEP